MFVDQNILNYKTCTCVYFQLCAYYKQKFGGKHRRVRVFEEIA